MCADVLLCLISTLFSCDFLFFFLFFFFSSGVGVASEKGRLLHEEGNSSSAVFARRSPRGVFGGPRGPLRYRLHLGKGSHERLPRGPAGPDEDLGHQAHGLRHGRAHSHSHHQRSAVLPPWLSPWSLAFSSVRPLPSEVLFKILLLSGVPPKTSWICSPSVRTSTASSGTARPESRPW